MFALIGEGDGKVPFTTAYLLARLDDEEMKRDLADRVVKGLLTRDGAEETVQKILQKTGCKHSHRSVKVTLPGLSLSLSVADITQARSLLAKVDGGLAKLEKHKFPLQNLPQVLAGTAEPP